MSKDTDGKDPLKARLREEWIADHAEREAGVSARPELIAEWRLYIEDQLRLPITPKLLSVLDMLEYVRDDSDETEENRKKYAYW